MNLSLTEENNLTKQQLLEMLHEAWDRVEYLEQQLDQESEIFEYTLSDVDKAYADGTEDGYRQGYDNGVNECICGGCFQ